jgi:hypothetical protein
MKGLARVLASVLVVPSVLVSIGLAGMDDRNYEFTVPMAQAKTGSTYVVRGELKGIYVDVYNTTTTCGVSVVEMDSAMSNTVQTLFSVANIGADTFYPILNGPNVDANGATIDTDTTAAGTNRLYTPFAISGPVRVIVTNATVSAATTNTYKLKLIFDE